MPPNGENILLPSYSLRVSVLENCQLRCAYCEPPRAKSSKQWLSVEDYQKIARVFSRFKLDKIRFTGGEPLLRKELPEIIAAFHTAQPSLKLCLTTNGLRFKVLAKILKEAGLKQVTFHLDTLQENRYAALMGKGSVGAIIDAIIEANSLDLMPKLNMVVQKGLNDDELIDFLDFSSRYHCEVRFIEMMNTGSAPQFVMQHFMSGEEILEKINIHQSTKQQVRNHRADPAENFFIAKREQNFGLIASDTRSFCADCNRIRLNAEGKLLTCLYDPYGYQLNFRGNEEELFAQIEKKIHAKESFHPALKRPHRRLFSMSEGGG